MRRSAPLLILLAIAACRAPGPAITEILWDRWGVPHIFARDNTDLFRAFGYTQAKSHGDLILKLYGQSRGRAAEYWGEANLATDRFVHTMGIPARARAWYGALPAHFRGYLDAFAAGFNEYATAHRDRIADSVEVVLPVISTDISAHALRIINCMFPMFGQVELPKGMAVTGDIGSNMWAIGPRRSASGRAMLLQNPHLPWGDLFLFMEAHLVSPDRNAYGVTLVGFPALGIAFNDHLGWSHTVNTQDGADVFRLTKRKGGYLLDGSVRAFDTATSEVKVKLAGGSLREDTLLTKRSVHGPVVEEDGRTALALRIAGLDDPGLQAWWEMSGARSLAEFEAALRPLHLPFFNIIYADREGHIYYLFGGKTPVRSRGDFGYWTPPVRGDSSALLWSEILPYERLPHVTDPPTGWLQNANDPPWTVTWPLVFDPDSFPPYLSPRSMGFRPQRSTRMLLADSSLTFEELVEYKHSTRMELADRILPALLQEARARGDADARRAADVLERWDRQANADSRGAVLFAFWARRWFDEAEGSPFARPWRLDSALTTPAGLKNPRAAVVSLGEAARKVRREYRTLDVPWGEVMRIRYGGKDLAGNGASGDPLGVFRVANYAPGDEGKFHLVAGDSYFAAVEFGNPLRARALLAYGNATQPGSRHRGDQLELFARKEMREVWRTRDEIERNLEEREELVARH